MELQPLHLISAISLIAISLAACNGWNSKLTVNEPEVTANSNGNTPESPFLATATAKHETTSSEWQIDLSQPLTAVPIQGEYQFAEGPATASDGSVYFSDIDAGKIYKWSPDGGVSLFFQGLDMPNGTEFDSNGNLIVCEGGAGRLISITPQGIITVLTDRYQGVRYNEPNDLWIDPKGGIYFTDPAFHEQVVQDGQDVYYLYPDHSQVIRVITNLNKPNGIVGTPDGKTLYVSDYGAEKTFHFEINGDGSLSNQALFIPIGSDGMELDSMGNLYLTTANQVQIYSTTGILLNQVATQETPTNLAFAGTDGFTLFITARTAVYTVQLSVNSLVATNIFQTGNAFALYSPDLPADGRLPAEYTCDGGASTLALSWNGTPEGTKSYAVVMHHEASATDIHWYLVLYNIPADVTSLPKNFKNIGALGTNSVNDRTEYAPPCSKGPGDKTYIYTVYALSADPHISVLPSQVTRAVLLDAIQNITLASAQLKVVYARP